MQSLESFYKTNEKNLLITAPPGWGKTYKFLEWAKSSENHFVYLSPLRAISEEFFRSAVEKMEGVYFPRTKKELGVLLQSKIKFKLLIVAFELFDRRLLLDKKSIFVFDEFHLVYSWGDSFREILMEVYREVISENKRALFLTATMKKENLVRMEEELRLNSGDLYFLDMGNQKLKNKPKVFFIYPKFFKKLLLKNLEREVLTNKKETILLFCQYRNEINYYASKFKSVHVLKARGGEVFDFSNELALTPKKVDLIIATTCLSHGVNLPKISKIFFTYEVDDIDFYIQMLGRGGRKGEEFEVHTLNDFRFNFISLFRLFFKSVVLKIKRGLSEF